MTICIAGPLPQTTGALLYPIDETADGSCHANHKAILTDGYGEFDALHCYTNHVHAP